MAGGQLNATETIQAAIDKLNALRTLSTPGVWTILDGGDRFIAEEAPLGDGPFEYIVTEPVEFRRQSDCDLIEVLHRTIDAQLAILTAASVDEYECAQEWAEMGKPHLRGQAKFVPINRAATALAKAILGDSA